MPSVHCEFQERTQSPASSQTYLLQNPFSHSKSCRSSIPRNTLGHCCSNQVKCPLSDDKNDAPERSPIGASAAGQDPRLSCRFCYQGDAHTGRTLPAAPARPDPTCPPGTRCQPLCPTQAPAAWAHSRLRLHVSKFCRDAGYRACLQVTVQITYDLYPTSTLIPTLPHNAHGECSGLAAS